MEEGEVIMATKVFHIELRVPGVTDPGKHDALKESVRVSARNLFGMALLVVGNDTKPAIAAYSEDFITGQDEITFDLVNATEDENG
jgi:hypothetical protein